MATEPSQQTTGGPIFIVGTMGSGSTLLRLILDSHEHIAIPQETGFMRAVLANKWIPYWRFGGKWYGRLDWTEDELNERLREFYGGMFQRFAQQQGKRRWGEKTPLHVWHMTEITRVFPDVVLVGIVRHPGGTTGSLMGRFQFTVAQGVRHWLEFNKELVSQATRLGDRFVLCRYEDLVLEPEATLRELLAWLDEPWSPGVLEHDRVQSEKGTPQQVDGRTRSDDPIDVGRVSKWTDALDVEARRLLTKQTAPLAGFFGYDIDDPLPLPSLVPAESPHRKILTGTELARRQADFRDTVDFEPPSRPMKEKPLKPKPRKQELREQAAKSERVDRPGPADAAVRRLPRPVRTRLRAAVRRLPAPVRSRLHAGVNKLLGKRFVAAGDQR